MFVDSVVFIEYGELKFMLTPNGRDLANGYLVQILERVYLGTLMIPIGWIGICPAFLDEDLQRCQQC